MGMSLSITMTSSSEIQSASSGSAHALSSCVTLGRLSPALACPDVENALARPGRRGHARADFSVWQSISISGTTTSPPEAFALERTFTYQALCSRELFKNPCCFSLVTLDHFPSPPQDASASFLISVFPRD